MIQNTLKRYGLTDTEISVYLTILENNKISPTVISKVTNIKRPTVYAAAEDLAKKGFIEKDTSHKTIFYKANDPKELQSIVEHEKRNFEEKERLVTEMIDELEKVPRSADYSVPSTRVIEGNDIIDFLYDRAIVWDQSMIKTGETTWWGFRDKSYSKDKAHLDWVNWYWERSSKQIDLKVFEKDSVAGREFDRKTSDRRKTKFWSDTDMEITQWILGEYIINYNTKTSPRYLVEIRDRQLAESLRTMYKRLWKLEKGSKRK